MASDTERRQPLEHHLHSANQASAPNGELLPGVEDSLWRLMDAQEKCIAIEDSFVSDESNYQLFQQSMAEQSEHTHDGVPCEGSPAVRKHIRRATERHFSDMVGIYIYSGRVGAIYGGKLRHTVRNSSEIIEGHGDTLSMGDVLQIGKEIRTRHVYSDAKKDQLMGNLHHQGDATIAFRGRLKDLETTTRKAYGGVVEQEDEALAYIGKQLDSGKLSASDLLGHVISISDSDLLPDRALMRLLTSNYQHRGVHSVLGGIMKRYKSMSEGAGLAREFIEHESSDEAESTLAFLREALSAELTGGRTIIDIMEERFDAWPQPLKNRYRTYAKDLAVEVKRTITAIVSRTNARAWERPDLGVLEVLVDRKFREIYGKAYSNGETKRGKRDPRSKAQRVGMSATSFASGRTASNGDRHEQPIEPMTAVIAKRRVVEGAGGMPKTVFEGQAVSSTREIVEAFVKDKGGKIIEDIIRVIDNVIKVDPFSTRGVKIIRGLSRRQIDGQSVRIYRLSPRDVNVPGYSVRRATKECRIIFGVAKGGEQVYVLGIATNHGQYETTLKSLLSEASA